MRYLENCSRTIFSYIFAATGNSDKGRLFDATSWSPFFRIGTTSAPFHAVGKEHVLRELLMVSVRGPRITGKLSLNIRAFSLSTPGDLFKGSEEMIRCTSSQVTALKLKSSLVGLEGSKDELTKKKNNAKDESFFLICQHTQLFTV